MKKQTVISLIFTFLFSFSNLSAQAWEEINSGISGSYRYYSVHFPTTSTGYISGTDGIILKSKDSGETWTQQNSNSSAELHKIHFIDENKGFAAGNKTLLTTIDGGSTWTKDSIPTNKYIYDAEFISDTLGFIIGTDGTIFRYSPDSFYVLDGGTSSDLDGMYFLDKDTGYATGGWFSSSSIIVKTTNGGETWETKTTPDDTALFNIHFPTASTGYAVGWEGKLIKSTNYGETWTNLSSGTSELLLDVQFIDELQGYTCGNQGTLLKTSDGGYSWQDVSITSEDLEDIYFANENLGFAVGYNTVLKYTGEQTNSNTQALSNSSLIAIYPNPANNYINVVFSDNACQLINVKIMDTSGRLVLTSTKPTLNITSLKSGKYILEVNSSQGIHRKLFLKL